VAVNCAALTPTLVESELFGREKGAYTGAVGMQIGRFELADRSTIFLDEVGELSLELQAKLLRVLQNGELERLGSPKTHRVDVRVVAATNRDLERAAREGSFRQDLYYRLNVFPITVPPLRGRQEDVPLLTWALVRELEAAMGRRVKAIPDATMTALCGHSWPGNVRELRNVLERAMILSSDGTLHVDLPGGTAAPSGEAPKTVVAVETQHIRTVLEQTGWKIRGSGGAAGILGLKPSTLESRIRKGRHEGPPLAR
jgi:transcriptional regulator with GAF, ATPase, and Fis domain